MTMSKPDLVFMKQGKPIAVVEAKGRPVPSQFLNAVQTQLRHFMAVTRSPWSILIDPDRTTIFRSNDVHRPWATFSTRELLQSADISSETIGERMLLRAVNRWIHALPSRREILELHPELHELARDVSDGVISTEDWPLGA